MIECLSGSNKGDDCNTVRVFISNSGGSVIGATLSYKTEENIIASKKADDKGLVILSSELIGKMVRLVVMGKEFFIPKLKQDTILRI